MVKVKPYFQIAGALHNLYGKRLLCDIGNEDVISNFILHNLEKPNDLQLYVEEKGLKRKRVCFEKLKKIQLFPSEVCSILYLLKEKVANPHPLKNCSQNKIKFKKNFGKFLIFGGGG